MVGTTDHAHRANGGPADAAQHDAEHSFAGLWRRHGTGVRLRCTVRLHVWPDGRTDRRRHRWLAVRSWLFRRDDGVWRLPGLPAPDRSDRAGGQLVGPLVPPSPIARVRWRTEHLRPRRHSRTRPDGRFRRTGGPTADPDRGTGLQGIRTTAA